MMALSNGNVRSLGILISTGPAWVSSLRLYWPARVSLRFRVRRLRHAWHNPSALAFSDALKVCSTVPPTVWSKYRVSCSCSIRMICPQLCYLAFVALLMVRFEFANPNLTRSRATLSRSAQNLIRYQRLMEPLFWVGSGLQIVIENGMPQYIEATLWVIVQ